jgi:hypothetical protein
MRPIEYEILLAASDTNPGEGQSEKLLGLIRHHFDQDRLVEMAMREGVAGLLYKNLKKIGVLGYLGHGQIARFQSFYYSAARLNLRLLYDLKKILQKLNQSKTRVVLLQGIHLLQQIYHDLGLRPLTDIDLWVLPENFDTLEKILTKLDYRKDSVYPKTFKRNSTIIDVNTDILWADRIKSRRFIMTASQDDIYKNCGVIDIDGNQAGCLNRVDQIIYLSLHAFKHNLNRLIWLVDIKNLLMGWKASDWVRLNKRSKQLGIEHVVHYILFYLDHLFKFPLPSEARDMYENRRSGYMESIVLQRRLKGNPLPVWGSLLLLPSGKGFRKRSNFFFENLFPGVEILRQVFPESSNLKAWRLYLKRALQLVGQVKL